MNSAAGFPSERTIGWGSNVSMGIPGSTSAVPHRFRPPRRRAADPPGWRGPGPAARERRGRLASRPCRTSPRQTSSSSARGSPGSWPPPSWPTPASGCILLDQEPEAVARRAGLLVLRRALPRRLPRAAPAAGHGLPRAGPPGLVRHGRLRPRGGPLAAPVGRGLRRVRRRREALLAARRRASACSRSSAGPSAAATPPTGHGNSVPRFHVTWGTGPGVVEPFARRVRAGVEAGTVELRFRHRVDRARRDRRRGRPASAARSSSPAASPRGEASSRTEVGRLRAPRAGGRRHLRRHRRQPRPGAPQLAGPARARRRSGCSPACPRTWTGACSRPRPAPARSVVNRDRMWHYTEGIANQLADLARARHPDPARARRRCGSTRSAAGCRCRCSPASTPSARWRTSARPGTSTPGSCSRRRSSRRSSRCRAPSRTPTSPARTSGCWSTGRAPAIAGAGAGVPGRGRGLRRRRDAARAGGRHERAHRGDAGARPGRPASARSSPATGRSRNPFTKDLQITADPRAPATTSATS